VAHTQFDLSVGVALTPTVTVELLGIGDLLFTIDGDTVQIRSKDNLGIIDTFGSTGAGDDNFSAPTDLCVDQNCVYVLDSGNSRIKKHIAKTGVYNNESALSWMAAAPNIPIAVDRRRLLFGKASVDTYVYDRHKNTFAEEHAYFDCGAGAVVGLAAIQGYFFVATATRVEKRLLSDGSLIATWNTVPAGFAVVGLATDGAWVFALCTKAVTDCKVVKLYVADLFENAVDDMTGKQTPTDICCDDTYVYFPNTADTTVNRVDNDLDPTSLLSIADCAAPQGICCLAPYFDDLPVESVGGFAAAVAAAPVLVGGPSAVNSLAAAVDASPALAAAISKPTTGVLGAAAAAAAPVLAAAIQAVEGFAAAVNASPALAAAISAGTTTFGAIAAVAATFGTVTDVEATVEV